MGFYEQFAYGSPSVLVCLIISMVSAVFIQAPDFTVYDATLA